nr:unnamed protein product [Digitaria exilis]
MQGSKHRVVTDLPKDLLVEIFSRVPYKSLCRCRCLSRSWHALCSDPNIVKKSPQTLSGFILHAGDKHGHPSPQPVGFSGLCRVQSCNEAVDYPAP